MVEPTHLKNMLVKLNHFSRVRGENKKYLKFHHLEKHGFHVEQTSCNVGPEPIVINGVMHLDVSKNRGTPKWMVYNGKTYWNGWFRGTTIFGNIHLEPPKPRCCSCWWSITWCCRCLTWSRRLVEGGEGVCTLGVPGVKRRWLKWHVFLEWNMGRERHCFTSSGCLKYSWTFFSIY